MAAPPAKPLVQPDGTVSLTHWYLLFRNVDLDEETVFAFPRHLPIRDCINAARSLVSEGWSFVEPEDGYGQPITQEQIDRWRRNDLEAKAKRAGLIPA